MFVHDHCFSYKQLIFGKNAEVNRFNVISGTN